jgi:hypothetical protein
MQGQNEDTRLSMRSIFRFYQLLMMRRLEDTGCDPLLSRSHSYDHIVMMIHLSSRFRSFSDAESNDGEEVVLDSNQMHVAAKLTIFPRLSF